MSENTFTVYKHTTPSGKVYIGITSVDVKDRWMSGHGYRHNSYFENAIKKYGWNNIKHEILLTELSKDEAENAEIELIKQFNSNDRKYGYNIESGGNSQGRMSEETKDKIRKSRTGRKASLETRMKISNNSKRENLSQETLLKMSIAKKGRKLSESKKKKISNAGIGRIVSEETRNKISIANKGRIDPRRIPVICVETGKIYHSMYEVELSGIATRSKVAEVCKGKRKTAGGYHWKYA